MDFFIEPTFFIEVKNVFVAVLLHNVVIPHLLLCP